MTAQSNRVAARGFTEANLSTLAADLLAWRKRAVLSNDCKLHALASLCIPFASDGDEYQEAERMIVTFALESAARGTASASSDAPVVRKAEALREQIVSLKSLIVDIGADNAVLNLNDRLIERMDAALLVPHN